MAGERVTNRHIFQNIDYGELRELTVTECQDEIFGQGVYQKVTAAHTARRAILDGVAGRAEASHQGIIQIRGYVYEGIANNGYLFITGNADVLYASRKGTIFLKKDTSMEGETQDATNTSGNVRVLRIETSGIAIIEGSVVEVTVSHGGSVTVKGDVRIARVEEAGEINVYGTIGERHLTGAQRFTSIQDRVVKGTSFKRIGPAK